MMPYIKQKNWVEIEFNFVFKKIEKFASGCVVYFKVTKLIIELKKFEILIR